MSTYYTLFTWVYDRFREVGYLDNLGPWGWGKSRWKNTVGGLCFRATFVGGCLTAPSLYHIIEFSKGTTVIDEADFTSADMQNGVLKVLTLGHEADNPLIRCDTENGGFVSYNPFGTKLYSHRLPIKDPALRSRCHRLDAKYDVASSKQTNLDDEFYVERQVLINKLLKFRFDRWLTTALDKTIQARLKVSEGRLKQIVIPMISAFPELNLEVQLAEYLKLKDSEMSHDRKQTNKYRLFTVILELVGNPIPDGMLKNSITVARIVETFNSLYSSGDWKLDVSYYGKLIRSIGLDTRLNDNKLRVLVWTKEQVENLMKEYGINSEGRGET